MRTPPSTRSLPKDREERAGTASSLTAPGRRVKVLHSHFCENLFTFLLCLRPDVARCMRAASEDNQPALTCQNRMVPEIISSALQSPHSLFSGCLWRNSGSFQYAQAIDLVLLKTRHVNIADMAGACLFGAGSVFSWKLPVGGIDVAQLFLNKMTSLNVAVTIDGKHV